MQKQLSSCIQVLSRPAAHVCGQRAGVDIVPVSLQGACQAAQLPGSCRNAQQAVRMRLGPDGDPCMPCNSLPRTKAPRYRAETLNGTACFGMLWRAPATSLTCIATPCLACSTRSRRVATGSPAELARPGGMGKLGKLCVIQNPAEVPKPCMEPQQFLRGWQNYTGAKVGSGPSSGWVLHGDSRASNHVHHRWLADGS